MDQIPIQSTKLSWKRVAWVLFVILIFAVVIGYWYFTSGKWLDGFFPIKGI